MLNSHISMVRMRGLVHTNSVDPHTLAAVRHLKMFYMMGNTHERESLFDDDSDGE